MWAMERPTRPLTDLGRLWSQDRVSDEKKETSSNAFSQELVFPLILSHPPEIMTPFCPLYSVLRQAGNFVSRCSGSAGKKRPVVKSRMNTSASNLLLTVTPPMSKRWVSSKAAAQWYIIGRGIE